MKVIQRVFAIVQILIVFNLCFTSNSQALTLSESINLAIQNSTEIQIEQKKSELTGLVRADAASMFLPNANVGMHRGHRKTSISKLNDTLKEDTQTITVNQPLFSGFQGVARVKESIHKTDAAKENLKFEKNNIALSVAESYLNILRLRKTVELESQQVINYKQVLVLAKKRLLLNDIEYTEYSDYEAKSQTTALKAEENKMKLREYELKFENLVKQRAENLARPLVHSNLESFDTMLILAQNDNPKVKSSRHTLKAAKSAVVAESGKLLPKVSLVLQRDEQKSSYYFNGLPITNRLIYLDINIPIFQSGSEYAGIAKANKQKQIANLEHKLALEEVEKAVKEEYHKFASLKESLVAFQEVFKGAIESLRLAESRFQKKDIGQMELLLKKIDVSEVEKQTIGVECDMLYSWFVMRGLVNDIVE